MRSWESLCSGTVSEKWKTWCLKASETGNNLDLMQKQVCWLGTGRWDATGRAQPCCPGAQRSSRVGSSAVQPAQGVKRPRTGHWSGHSLFSKFILRQESWGKSGQGLGNNTLATPCCQSIYITFLSALGHEAQSRGLGGAFATPVPTRFVLVGSECSACSKWQEPLPRRPMLRAHSAAPVAGVGQFQGRQLLAGRSSLP